MCEGFQSFVEILKILTFSCFGLLQPKFQRQKKNSTNVQNRAENVSFDVSYVCRSVHFHDPIKKIHQYAKTNTSFAALRIQKLIHNNENKSEPTGSRSKILEPLRPCAIIANNNSARPFWPRTRLVRWKELQSLYFLFSPGWIGFRVKRYDQMETRVLTAIKDFTHVFVRTFPPRFLTFFLFLVHLRQFICSNFLIFTRLLAPF